MLDQMMPLDQQQRTSNTGISTRGSSLEQRVLGGSGGVGGGGGYHHQGLHHLHHHPSNLTSQVTTTSSAGGVTINAGAGAPLSYARSADTPDTGGRLAVVC